jgi:WhiB family transcriptional regulator, redox-sensing transcriptional regulator
MNMPAAAHGARDWLDLGACRGEDPDLFFPITSVGPGVAQVVAAKAVCARCAVREMCLSFALDAHQDYGVWGGLSEDERRSLRLAPGHQPEYLAG